MSMRYKGSVISATPPTLVTNAGASGAWTLEQQMQANAAGLWPKNGPFNYIEDVFQTWLYTGTGSAQTINNGIDLAGKGGLVWIKSRTTNNWNVLTDTVRGAGQNLFSNATSGQQNFSQPTFASNGFNLLFNNSDMNGAAGQNYASWTFREQAKFFDIQTWTSANSATQRTISHNLGSTPGCVIIKCLNSHSSSLNEWYVVHRYDITAQGYLNRAFAFAPGVPVVTAWTDTTVTFASDFNTGTNNYVVYLFAHNAGGFGLTGTDNVISCGSFTQASGGTTVNLGFEPQWVMVKNASGTGNWFIFDNMRGNTVTLYPNLSNAEGDQGAGSFQYNATGFTMADYITGSVGSNLIYIAIRRGPMAVPTNGTSVFAPVLSSTTPTVLTSNFPVDMALAGTRSPSGYEKGINDRLRGFSNTSSGTSPWIATQYTQAEVDNTGSPTYYFANNTSITTGPYTSGTTVANYLFRRSPGYMDVVCYTANGSITSQTITHNLTVAPELMIMKARSSGSSWWTYHAALGATQYVLLNTTAASASSPDAWDNTDPTASQFTVGFNLNGTAGITWVAYLFASCPGVSKVGSFTGTSATQVIDCGFNGGARFVLIKATSTTGNWMIWDSARGIVAGNDPYLALNSTAAEVTNTDWVDTAATGFELSNAGGNLANSNGVSYIFLAIA